MVFSSELVATLAGAGLALGLTTGLSPATESRASSPAPRTAAGAEPRGPVAQPDDWAWPLLPQPDVVHRFAPPRRRWEPGHRGVDLRASVGQSVHAPAAGEVTFAARLAGRGVVVVRHPGGPRSTFEPVAGSVSVGATVARGQVVGLVTDDRTHCEPTTCLHWGVIRGREYLDPLSLLGRFPVVLLPLG
ncbi:peptidoglycan DD-metalloendopeptidase family protein [Intrasporangium sp. DVR]|uniref:murein hydrolase activator EnvC family protein n=1 Tax=Intrasporangium sp. DVR TaxID=3127867 RepID=UPI00313A6FCC